MIFALTGPSGAGKTTFAKMLLEKYHDIAVQSHTVTTREPRRGKDESSQYTFVNKNEFNKMIKDDKFACWTEFCGNLYGITKKFIENIIASGKILILDSIQNPAQVLKLHPNTVVVYLSVPKQEAENRIRNRDKIDEKDIKLRLADYDRQESFKNFCTHKVITSSNESSIQVFNKLVSIFEKTMIY